MARVRVAAVRPRPSGDDQPVLPLGVSARPASTRTALEEALVVAAPFDGADWWFSIDWDGMRVAVEVVDGSVRIHDGRLRDVGIHCPEVVGALPAALRGHHAVLEGVVAVLDGEGRPDLRALMRRLAGDTRAGQAGPVLLVTDLLALDGASLAATPFAARRQAMLDAVAPATHVQVPEWVIDQGRALVDAAAERGLAAVAARHAAAPYRAGVASPQRLRILVEERCDAVVVGAVRDRGGEPVALVLAEWHDGRLVDAGRVAVDAALVPRGWLRRRVEVLRAEPQDVAGLEGTADVEWMRPSLVATVAHHGRADDGRPRLPAPVALREDVEPRWCVRRAVAPVPAVPVPPDRAFQPRVLLTLPFAHV